MRSAVAVILFLPWALASAEAESSSCAAGNYLQVSSADDTGDTSTQCVECPPNTYSARDANICTKCEAGTSSQSGAAECTSNQTSRLTIFVWILCVLSVGVLARLVQIKREQNRRAKARLAGNPAGQRRWASARVVPIADSRFPRRQDELGTEVPQPPVSATVSPIEMTSVVIHPTAATPEGTTAFCSPSSPPSAPTDPSTPLAPLSSSTEHIPAASAVKLFSTASNDSMPMASAVASELPVLAERCMYGGGVHPRL